MRTVQIRLNDIVNNNTIIPIEEDNETQLFLYNSVIGAYKYAYVCADNIEQFTSDFKTLWDRYYNYYSNLFERQVELSSNLFKARVETRNFNKKSTDTPNLEDTETWTFGRKDTTEYGKELTITPDITETRTPNLSQSVTQKGTDKTVTTENETAYGRQTRIINSETERTPNLISTSNNTGNETNKRNGTEKHTNGGTDTNTSSGENGRKLKRNGERVISIDDTGNGTITEYNADLFEQIMSGNFVVDKFIDLFSPLFQDIIFYSGVLE